MMFHQIVGYISQFALSFSCFKNELHMASLTLKARFHACANKCISKQRWAKQFALGSLHRV